MSNPFWDMWNFWDDGYIRRLHTPPLPHDPNEVIAYKVEGILAEYFIGHPEEKIPETEEEAGAFFDSHPDLMKKIEDKIKEKGP